MLKNEYTEALEERAVDQVVVENGILPNDGLYWQLKPLSLNKGQTDIDALYDALPQPGLSQATGNGDFLLYRVGDSRLHAQHPRRDLRLAAPVQGFLTCCPTW